MTEQEIEQIAEAIEKATKLLNESIQMLLQNVSTINKDELENTILFFNTTIEKLTQVKNTKELKEPDQNRIDVLLKNLQEKKQQLEKLQQEKQSEFEKKRQFFSSKSHQPTPLSIERRPTPQSKKLTKDSTLGSDAPESTASGAATPSSNASRSDVPKSATSASLSPIKIETPTTSQPNNDSNYGIPKNTVQNLRAIFEKEAPSAEILPSDNTGAKKFTKITPSPVSTLTSNPTSGAQKKNEQEKTDSSSKKQPKSLTTPSVSHDKAPPLNTETTLANTTGNDSIVASDPKLDKTGKVKKRAAEIDAHTRKKQTPVISRTDKRWQRPPAVTTTTPVRNPGKSFNPKNTQTNSSSATPTTSPTTPAMERDRGGNTDNPNAKPLIPSAQDIETLTEGLTEAEKRMWTDVLKQLKSNGQAPALVKTIEEALEKPAVHATRLYKKDKKVIERDHHEHSAKDMSDKSYEFKSSTDIPCEETKDKIVMPPVSDKNIRYITAIECLDQMAENTDFKHEKLDIRCNDFELMEILYAHAESKGIQIGDFVYIGDSPLSDQQQELLKQWSNRSAKPITISATDPISVPAATPAPVAIENPAAVIEQPVTVNSSARASYTTILPSIEEYKDEQAAQFKAFSAAKDNERTQILEKLSSSIRKRDQKPTAESASVNNSDVTAVETPKPTVATGNQTPKVSPNNDAANTTEKPQTFVPPPPPPPTKSARNLNQNSTQTEKHTRTSSDNSFFNTKTATIPSNAELLAARQKLKSPQVTAPSQPLAQAASQTTSAAKPKLTSEAPPTPPTSTATKIEKEEVEPRTPNNSL